MFQIWRREESRFLRGELFFCPNLPVWLIYITRLFQNNPDGIASVTFKDPEQADDCIKMMDWRHFEGKRLRAEQWDGKTKYKVEETEEDRKRRLAGWRNYLEAGAASDDGASAKDQAESGAGNNV